MSSAPVPPAAIDVGALFNAAKATFTRTLAKCLGRALLAMLCSALPNLYLIARGVTFDLSKPPADPAFWALMAVGVVGYQCAAAALLRRQALLLGLLPAADPGGEFGAIARALPTMLGGALVAAMTVTLAAASVQLAMSTPLAALAAVPAAWLFITLLPLRPVALLERAGPLQALRRCALLAQGRWLRFLATGAIAAMILVVCVLAAGIVLELLRQGLAAVGAPEPAVTALVAAATLAVEATAIVYLNAVWLALHGAASHSAASSSA